MAGSNKPSKNDHARKEFIEIKRDIDSLNYELLRERDPDVIIAHGLKIMGRLRSFLTLIQKEKKDGETE